MAYLLANPELIAAAVSDLATIGSDLRASQLAAAARTTSVVPAAADEVSAAIANLMSNNALAFQEMRQSASTFHQQFANNVNAAAAAYSGAESAAATKLTPTLLSLSDFFRIVQSDFATSSGNFVDSFRSFPNLRWDQLGSATNDALVILLWPITYPVTAFTVFALEAVFDAILNAFIP
jgi:hypothetical protein